MNTRFFKALVSFLLGAACLSAYAQPIPTGLVCIASLPKSKNQVHVNLARVDTLYRTSALFEYVVMESAGKPIAQIEFTSVNEADNYLKLLILQQAMCLSNPQSPAPVGYSEPPADSSAYGLKQIPGERRVR